MNRAKESIERALDRLREVPEIVGLGNFHGTTVGGRHLFGPIWWFQGDLWWARSDLLVRPIPTLWRKVVTALKGTAHDLR